MSCGSYEKSHDTGMNCYQITSVYELTEASPGMTQTVVDDPVELRAETVGKSFP